MPVDIGKVMGEGSMMGPPSPEDEMDDAVEMHLAAYNRAVKSNDIKGQAAAFKAAVAACGGYGEPEME